MMTTVELGPPYSAKHSSQAGSTANVTQLCGGECGSPWTTQVAPHGHLVCGFMCPDAVQQRLRMAEMCPGCCSGAVCLTKADDAYAVHQF
jgi:hypothetical protein